MSEMPTRIPQDILDEIAIEQKRLQWPELVPAYAEFRDANGKVLFCRYRDLTVALCEQATEFHTRRAVRSISKYSQTCVKKYATSAAKDIVKARVFRCRQFDLLGIAKTSEDDMPFPRGTYLNN